MSYKIKKGTLIGATLLGHSVGIDYKKEKNMVKKSKGRKKK